jgi:hypothetical protein
MSVSNQEVLDQVIANIQQTKHGKDLFGRDADGRSIEFRFRQNSTEAAFIYPNVFEIGNTLLHAGPVDLSYVKGELAFSLLHEEMHRHQSRKPAAIDFFTGLLRPMAYVSAELLIEADNAARTTQCAWRIATDQERPFPELGRHILQILTKGVDTAYIRQVRNKPFSEENETIAMQKAVKAFFEGDRVRFYARYAVNFLYNIIDTDILTQPANEVGAAEIRDRMRGHRVMRSFGPDTVDYNADAFVDLGQTPGGNIFDYHKSTRAFLTDPKLALRFLDREYQAKLERLINFSNQFSEWVNSAQPVRFEEIRTKPTGKFDYRL